MKSKIQFFKLLLTVSVINSATVSWSQNNDSIIIIKSPELYKSSDYGIHAIAIDSKGEMFVGGKHSIYKVNQDKTIINYYQLADTSSKTIIWSMIFDKEDNLYIAAHDRIVKLSPDKDETVIVQENFPGPCGVTEIRFDKLGNLYAVYDNMVAKYNSDLQKEIIVNGNDLNPPIKWAVGIEFSDNEDYLYLGDCRGKKAYILSLENPGAIEIVKTYPTNWGQYFTKDNSGNIFLTSIGGEKSIPELLVFKNKTEISKIHCTKKPLQQKGCHKKTMVFAKNPENKNVIYCIIGNNIYLYDIN